MMFTIREILDATQGELIKGSLKGGVRRVSTDTRTVGKKDLFIAIKGEKFDGHDFLAQAAASGASVLLVSQRDLSFPEKCAVICVDDTVKAYGFLARFHRRRFDIPVIAITGSAGKTTTKEFIAAVLKTRHKVHYSRGTENNHIGVPSTLLGLKKSHSAAVIEAGTNHHGEIAWLGSLIEPTMAVFTNIGPAHLEGLGDEDGVLREKSTLIGSLKADGTVIINSDDPYLRKLLDKRYSQKVVTYGVDREADVKASDAVVGSGKIRFQVKKEIFTIKSLAAANVYNALAAIAAGLSLGIPAESIRRGLLRFQSAKGRQIVHKVNGLTIIDDTYNANPLSYKNAIRTLSMIKGEGRAVLVGADMLELGASSEPLHREIGEFAAKNGIDVLLTCGQAARWISDSASGASGATEARHFDSKDGMTDVISQILRPGDVVLAKGSRGMRMETVVEDILKNLRIPPGGIRRRIC